MIGILRWAVELGRVDIITEVSIMAGFTAMPRAGHLEALCRLFAHLKTHKRSKLVMDSSYPKVPQPEPQDWHQFYGDVKEEIPPDAPKTRGNYVEMTTFTDSDHANDKLNRRSRTGVLIFVNREIGRAHV